MEYQDFFNDSGRINSMKVKQDWLKKHNFELYERVENYITLYQIKTNRFVEKLWYYFNQVKSTVECKNSSCHHEPGFLGLKNGFLEYCSSKCSNSSDLVKNEKIKSNLKKYGVENPYQSDEIKQKIKDSLVEKYGVENPMFSEKIKNKMINNSIKNRGVEWPLSRGGKSNETR